MTFALTERWYYAPFVTLSNCRVSNHLTRARFLVYNSILQLIKESLRYSRLFTKCQIKWPINNSGGRGTLSSGFIAWAQVSSPMKGCGWWITSYNAAEWTQMLEGHQTNSCAFHSCLLMFWGKMFQQTVSFWLVLFNASLSDFKTGIILLFNHNKSQSFSPSLTTVHTLEMDIHI